MIRPGQAIGRPLTQTERNRRYRARRRGELSPYPGLDRRNLLMNTIERGDCLEWTRARTPKGYGRMSVAGRLVYPHRVVLELSLGRPIAPGMVARHTCDNPPCIEPTHLIEGTPLENAWDRESRGRHRVAP